MPMNEAQMREVIKRLPPLGAVLRITFEESEAGLRTLAGLNNLQQETSAICVDERDEMLVLAVLHSRSWGRAANKTLRFFFRAVYFRSPGGEMIVHVVAALAAGILKVEPYDEHLLSGIHTGRVKKRQDFIDALKRECLPDDLRTDLESWGTTVDFSVIESVPGFPDIFFRLMAGDEEIGRVHLDGWIGKIHISGSEDVRRYGGPEDVHKGLRKILLSYFDPAS